MSDPAQTPCASDFWERVLSHLRNNVGIQSFETWFRPILCAGRDENGVHLTVPNERFKRSLLANYSAALNNAIGQAAGVPLEFDVSVEAPQEVCARPSESDLPLPVVKAAALEPAGNRQPWLVEGLWTAAAVGVILVAAAFNLRVPPPPPKRAPYIKVMWKASVGPLEQGEKEVAYRLAGRFEADVLALHVITRGVTGGGSSPAVAQQLERVKDVARAFGADSALAVRYGAVPADELLRAADEWAADTIVLGTSVRSHDGRPFLGHGTVWLLEHARQTMVAEVFSTGTGEE